MPDAAALRTTLSEPDVVLVEPYLRDTSTPEVARALGDLRHRTLGLGVGQGELRRYGSREEHEAAHGIDVAGLTHSITAFLGR